MAERHVRTDVWIAEDGSKAAAWDERVLAYARAVAVMKARPADDPASWAAQAALQRECPRRTWFFLPWLRMRLWYFERIVRAIVVDAGGPRDWALPFWNYGSDGAPGAAALPRAFAVPTLPDGGPNPLHRADAERAAWLNAGTPLPGTVTSAARALAARSFSPGLGGLPPACPGAEPPPPGLLEAQPHDSVAAVLGRDAPLDPIFPLHLANIDRLWEVWRARGDGRANPVQFDWTDHSFSFRDADGRARGLTCGQVGDLANLDYGYAGLAPPAGAERVLADEADVHPVPVWPGTGRQLASCPGGGVQLGAEPLRVALRPAAGALGLAEAAREAGAALAPRVYLHVADAEADAVPGSVWEVRVGGGRYGARGGGETSVARDAPVGTIAFSRGRAGTERFVFDITDAVDDLEAAGDWDDRAVAVCFRPALPAELERQPPPAARVGRVFVTHG
jgi:hypothetical protein